MGTEIERKFRIQSEEWKQHISRTIYIRQGYLSSDAERTVRVRLWGEEGKLTIKSKTIKASRMEFEYDIPKADALEMLEKLCPFPQIQKKRHHIVSKNHIWEIDVFEGHNKGLVLAEIELSAEDEEFEKPAWLGEEVTTDHRYSNSYLAQHSFRSFLEP